MECQCYTPKTPLARVDNVFEFNGKKILLEVKLNIELENNLPSQLNQYLLADYICLSNQQNNHITDFEKSYMFVMDVYSVYKYWATSGRIEKMFDLDEIKNKKDIIDKMSAIIL